MGNNQSEHSPHRSEQRSTFYTPSTEGGEKENQCDDGLLETVETELDHINSTIKEIKCKTPDEIKQQLHTLLVDTEKKLRHVNNEKKKWHVKNPFKHKEAICSDNDSQLKEENVKLRQEIENLKKLRLENKDKLMEEEMKKEELLLRKVADEKSTKDNPAIPDFSDSNRPTKLDEVYSELYDNEWTDAFDGLTGGGHDDEEAISTLHLTLLNVYDFCKKKAQTMLTKTDDAVNYLFEEYKLLQDNPGTNDASVTTMQKKRLSNMQKSDFSEGGEEDNFELTEKWRYKKDNGTGTENVRASMALQRFEAILDKLKVFQKEVAEIMVPVVQKAYFKASWRNDEFVPALKPFIRKCIYVCWMMVVQSLPMCIHVIDVNEQDKFDKNLYREYTTSGSHIKYIVWPAMLLHENGPVVCKGIAQGCDQVCSANDPQSASDV
ncbi:uncharacterized protein LOC132740787 [Ruditapes philippinarum]|uniref:uncharacterized protein LOC132740787 n=1 Tax=Ruditapes philippinarum TaxID=129788 RepID=UPI00295ABA4A|nr:uncharacterized protein LOC132740787 [Ruditapes philippinarum]